MNFYKHHIGDYAAATAHLSILEDGCYSRLLRIYYRDEKPLPADAKAVQRAVGARSKDEREAVQTVLEEFFQLEVDGWHNKRADEEIVRANAQADTNRRIAEEREARKKARMANESLNGSSTATGNESFQLREPSQTPDSRLQTKAEEQDQERPPAAASVDPVKDLIDGGVAYLGECGVGPKQARSVIGLVRKTVADDFVAAELLAVAQRDHVADPVAWLRKAAIKRATAGSVTSAYQPLPGEI